MQTETKYPKYRPKEPKYEGKSESTLEFKFWSGGKAYFGLVNPKSLNKVRFDAVQQIYRELERGLDSEKLEGLLTVVEEALWSKDDSRQKEALYLVRSVSTRDKIANHAYLAFKMASVYYVGIDEDFDKWDWEIARKKVQHWMKHETDLESFFLQTHVSNLLPYIEFLGNNIREYSENQKATDNNQVAIMLEILREINSKTGSEKTNDTIASLILRQWPTGNTEQITT